MRRNAVTSQRKPLAARDRRLTKLDYCRAGLQLLAEGGIGAVTIANVCARLRVTKGSFYHHFDSAPAFHRELLDYYEDEYARRRIAEVEAVTGATERLDALLQRGVERDHEAESALRAWSRTDPLAAEVMQRVDAARTQYLSNFLVAEGVAPAVARVHADVALALVAGAQAMSRITDRRKLRSMLEEHRRWTLRMIDEAQTARRATRSAARR